MTDLSSLDIEILKLLKEDARRSPDLIATMLGVQVEEVQSAIAEMERKHVMVTALIEVQITPERGRGFEGIAERIYLFPQVKAVYLMSGSYDLQVEVQGKSLREVASFVSDKLSPIEAVLSTKTHFILKKYKQDGIIYEEREDDQRLVVTP